MWFFSGRRGVHCWIMDTSIGYLDSSSRKAILSFFQLTFSEWENHEVIRNIVFEDAPKAMFEYLITQPPEFAVNKLLNLIKNCCINFNFNLAMRDPLNNLLAMNVDPKKKLRAFVDYLVLLLKSENRQQNREVFEIISRFLLPRMDTNVSVQPGHLIKAPFCIHPSTRTFY